MISVNATFIIQLINMLVLIFVLNAMLYKPIKRIIAERQARLDADRTEADSLAQRSQDALDTYQTERKMGMNLVRERLHELREKADHEASVMRLEAQEKAKQHQVALMERIELELESVRGEIRTEAEKVAVSLAARVLGREVS